MPAGFWITLGISLTLLLLGLCTREHARQSGSGSKAQKIPDHKVLPCVTRASWALNSSWELPAACSRLPAGWVELVTRQAAKSALRMPVAGKHVVASANSVLIHDNRLWWLNPIAGKYTDGFANSSVILRSRPLQIAQALRQLSSMHRLPDAVFQLSVGDVPTDVHNGGLPTLSIHGWVGGSVPILRYPDIHPSDSGIAMAQPIRWADKSRRLVYSDGHAWKSGMPSDPFRAGRAKVRQLAREHPTDIYLPTQPNSAQLKSIPYKEWRKHKYVLYVDQHGESGAPCTPQRFSTASVPPQGAPSGSGQLGTPRKRPAHVCAQPLPRQLELVASKAAGLTASDRSG